MSFDELERAGRLDGMEWEYVAHEDACELGRSLHGRVLGSLAEVYQLLPGFAANPGCSQACSCTALPRHAQPPR